MENIKKILGNYRELIEQTFNYIWENPETGYKEVKTSKYMEKVFTDLGYDIVKADDITGFYTVLDTGVKGPEILVLAELDALICKAHPDADKTTGAVHVCGHAAQCAALVGVAAALKDKIVTKDLCGRIRLCVVPAEELIEVEYRSELVKQGKIKYLGGKTEFLRRGYFDGVDLAFMVHTTNVENFCVNQGGVGCIVKKIIYKGKSAHAGGSPWSGVNALYAASQGLNAINAIRETFKESDIIRVHPIMTAGGDAVNAIPHQAVIESYVRGSNFEGMIDANKRVNRALCGAALSIGANVEIQDMPGYAPYKNDVGMIEIAKQALSKVYPEQEFVDTGVISSGSTDMGDLSCVMPMIHPYASGATGATHGSDYFINDFDSACIKSAVWQISMLKLLLENGGERAISIKNSYKPLFKTKEDYFDYLESFVSSGDRIEYLDNGVFVKA